MFYVVFLLVSSVLLTELALRAYFAYRVGPDILMYGIRSGSVSFEDSGAGAVAEPSKPPHPGIAQRFFGDMIRRARLESPAWYPDARSRGYRKYGPNQVRYDFSSGSGERFQVKINSRGFRGRDFAEAKESGVIRVITLGASSTFGYYNRDSETYPAQLEQILRSGCTTKNYEVINLGIPHLKASQIAALFVSEGLALDPDVVTFYEGVNDAMSLATRAKPRAPWLDSVARRVLVVGFLEHVVGWNDPRLSPREFEKRAEEVNRRFLAAVARIYTLCRRRGINFVVSNQGVTSVAAARSELDTVSYADEEGRILRLIRSSGRVPSWGAAFLAHARMMRNLENWARTQDGISFVDVIGGLDGRRSLLASYVHLTPEGNRAVAALLARPILAQTCGRSSDDDEARAADRFSAEVVP